MLSVSTITAKNITTLKMFNMTSEWLFHNIAYELHLKRKSTADADIEYTGDCRPYVYISTIVLEILGSE